MRYTECRLTRIATELLRDIDADTVDFKPNYDESRREPTVLPSRFPNLLVNGSSGIAVGMATNIPPHHLGETIDALVAMIDDPGDRHRPADEARQGARLPDRRDHRRPRRDPRGVPLGARPHRHARARAHRGAARRRTAVVINELPYGVKKGGDEGVIKKIADLVKEGVLSEIADLKDLSDKSGMRIEVHLKRDAVPQVALNKLYKHTPLQTTFGYNAVALVDGVPRTLGLRDLLYHYLEHQREVVTRRLKYELRQAEARAHVLEGYLIALDNLDEVIALIRARRRHGRGAHGADRALRADRDPGAGDPRPPPARAHRASSGSASRTSTPTCRSGSPSCARSSATRRASTRSSARSCSRSSRSTARTTTAAPRSSPPRASSSSRT